MKLHILIMAVCGFVGATAAHAQKAPQPTDPVEEGQKAFGEIVGANFRVPDQAAAVVAPGASAALAPTLGGALRTSLEIPGGIFVGLVNPFADADAAANPTPAAAAASAARPHRHGRLRHKSPALG